MTSVADSGAPARIVSGRLVFETPSHELLLSTLPDAIVMAAADGPEAARMCQLMQTIADELDRHRQGSSAIANDLATALLVMGLCGALPVAVALGAGGLWWWQQRRKPSAPPLSQIAGDLKRPRQSLHPSLATAMRGNDNNYKVVSLALQNYLSAALQTPVKGLTRTELARRLRQTGLAEGLIERLEACLAHSEMGRYGPATADAGWELMAETEALLQELERVLKVGDVAGKQRG